MGKQYVAKVGNLYLQGKDTTSDIEEADIFESETEPRQRINQMKKDRAAIHRRNVANNNAVTVNKVIEVKIK